MSRRSIILLSILAIGISLRLLGIGWGLPGADRFFSYSPDEFTVFHWLSNMKPHEFNFNPQTYFNGTLFMFIFAFILKILSLIKAVVLTYSWDFYHNFPYEWARLYLSGRLLILVFSILTIYLTYLLGKRLYSAKTGLLSAFFLSITPLHIIVSHQIIIDIPTLFWLTLYLYFSSAILSSDKYSNYIFSGFSAGCALATKITSLPVIPFLLIIHLIGVLNVGRERFNFKGVLKIIFDKRLIVAYLILSVTYFVFNPYLLVNFENAAKQFQEFYRLTERHWGFSPCRFIIPVVSHLFFGLGLPLLILAIMGFTYTIFTFRKKQNLFLITWVCINYYLIARTNTPFAKYQLVILPAILIIVSEFIVLSVEYFKNRFQKNLIIFIIVIISLFTFSYSLSYDILMSRRDIRDTASEWIKDSIPMASGIAVAREPYYFSPPIIFNQYFYTGNSKYIRSERLYNIINLNYDIKSLQALMPEFVIVSDSEFYGEKYSFIQYLSKEGGYKLIKKFDKPEYTKLFLFRNKSYPRDFLYLFPTIYIFRRIS